MKSRLLFLVAIFALLSWLDGPLSLAADVVDGTAPGPRKQHATSYVTVFRQRDGIPALLIEYPWKAHPGASLEIRLVTDPGESPREIQPLQFVKNLMKGEVAVAVHRCRQEAWNKAATCAIEHDEMEFVIFGQRNSLGKPAVCVAHRIKPKDPTSNADDEEAVPQSGPVGTEVVFCFLSSWSVDKNTLCVEPPRGFLASSGRLHVWFLRGKEIVWKENLDWPGHDRT